MQEAFIANAHYLQARLPQSAQLQVVGLSTCGCIKVREDGIAACASACVLVQPAASWNGIAGSWEGVEHQLTDVLSTSGQVVGEVTIVGIADL